MTSLLAVRYTGARTLTTGPAHSTPPAPGQVELAPAYVGICGTDLHIYHGHMDTRVNTPTVIGHEMSGRVLRVGQDVHDVTPGDPVTVIPLRYDGTCPACQHGHHHICQNLEFIGIDSPGAMQQRWTVPADTLIPLPHTLPLHHAALIEPTAVAVHDVTRAAIQQNEQVLVVGGGPVGVLIALVAQAKGADLRVLEPNPHRRALAQTLGLSTWDPTTDDIPALVQAWTAGAGAHVAFEVSGAQTGLATAIDALAARGRLCLVAIHPTPREVNLHRFFWRELTLIGARLYQRTDFHTATRLITQGTIPAGKLITKIVPLTETPTAFQALETGGDIMKILIDCTSPHSGEPA